MHPKNWTTISPLINDNLFLPKMSTCPRVGAVTWWLVTLAVIMLLAAAWSVDDTIVPRGPDADEPLLSWFPDPPPPPRFEPPTPPASPQTPPPAPAPARLQTPPQTPLTPELNLHGQNAAHYTTNSSKEVPTVSSTRATTTGSASSSPTSMSTTSASSSPTSIFDRYEVKCAPPQPLLAWLCIKYMCHISIHVSCRCSSKFNYKYHRHSHAQLRACHEYIYSNVPTMAVLHTRPAYSYT